MDALHGISLSLCPICATLTVTLVSKTFSLHVDTVGGSENTPAVVLKVAAREPKRTVETLLQLSGAINDFFFSLQIKTLTDVWKISKLKKRAKIVFNAQWKEMR